VAGFRRERFCRVERFEMEIKEPQGSSAGSLRIIFFTLADEHRKFFAKSVCQFLQGVDGRDRNSAFDLAEIATVQVGESSERLLGQATALPVRAEYAAKFSGDCEHFRSISPRALDIYML